MSSDASKEHSGTIKELKQKREKIKLQIRHHIKQQQQHDKSESKENKRNKRSQQAINTLNAHSKKIEKFLKDNVPRQGHEKRPTGR